MLTTRGAGPVLPWAAAAVLTLAVTPVRAQQGQSASAAAAPVALSESLEHARILYLEAAFERARESFEAVLASSELDVASAVEAHRFLGALALVVNDTASARRHVEAALSLDPGVTAPEGAPPELAELLDAARGEGGAAALTIEPASPELRAGQPASIAARLDPAPPALASRLRLGCSGDGVPEVEGEGSPPTVEVTLAPTDEAEGVRCEASAETESGAALLRAAVELPIRPADPVVEEPGGRLWWPWVVGFGGAAVVAAVVTAVVLTTAGPDDAYIDAPQVEGF